MAVRDGLQRRHDVLQGMYSAETSRITSRNAIRWVFRGRARSGMSAACPTTPAHPTVRNRRVACRTSSASPAMPRESTARPKVSKVAALSGACACLASRDLLVALSAILQNLIHAIVGLGRQVIELR
jgi:hypothetical protein